MRDPRGFTSHQSRLRYAIGAAGDLDVGSSQEIGHAREGEQDAEPFGVQRRGACASIRAQGSKPCVLVDSRTNETTRPQLTTMSIVQRNHTSVTTASCHRVEALDLAH